LASSLTTGEWVQLRYEDCDDRMTATLRTMGLTLPSPTTTDGAGDRLENTEELCQNLLIVLFTIMWKGIESTPTDDTTWQVVTLSDLFISFKAHLRNLVIHFAKVMKVRSEAFHQLLIFSSNINGLAPVVYDTMHIAEYLQWVNA